MIFPSPKGKFLPILGVVFSSLLATNVYSAGDMHLEEVTVPAKAFKYPKLNMDGVDYKYVRFEYAVSGDLKVKSREVLEETLTCDGKQVKKQYLKIKHDGPRVFFRVSDKSQTLTLHMQEFDTENESYFGQNDCEAPANIVKKFEEDYKSWKGEEQGRAVASAIDNMYDFVRNHSIPGYKDHTVPIYRIRSEDTEFSNFREAFSLSEKGISFDPPSSADKTKLLQEATKLWKEELARIEKLDDKAYKPLERAIHQNLAKVYFFAVDYPNAIKHDKLASSLGMPASESWMKTITEYQSDKMLSPLTSTSITEMFNSWRRGRSFIPNSKIEEVDFSVLEPSMAELN